MVNGGHLKMEAEIFFYETGGDSFQIEETRAIANTGMGIAQQHGEATLA